MFRSKTPMAIFKPIACLVPLMLAGCSQNNQADSTFSKKPRPVETRILKLSPPPKSMVVSASVGSWKTEQIGFEVGGRIEWVAEPDTSIEGRIMDADGKPFIAGTPIARVESERYQLQIDIAKADYERAQQSVAAGMIEYEKTIPSQIRAAESEMKLAQTEYERTKQLFEQKAIAQADMDRDTANFQTAIAKVEQLRASLSTKAADVRSLQLQVQQAQQSLRDAERSLEDCTLFSSFRGQIADVVVVPGSVVAAGEPVATVQMMDPIKIELEVSAEDSRRLRGRQKLSILLPQQDGQVQREEGFLYLIDPVADPLTRTFTVTLLMLNQKESATPEDPSSQLATTDQAWRLDLSFVPGADPNMTYVAEEAIRTDEQGKFLWRITNIKQHQPIPANHMLSVEKLRITAGETRLPFLGNWVFRQIQVADNSFDPKTEVVAGKLTVPGGNADAWAGSEVKLDRSNNFLVRPGDVVQVDLSDNDGTPGFYVPMDAVVHVDDKTFLLAVDSEGNSNVVRQLEVTMDDKEADAGVNSNLRIQAANGESLEGVQYVTKGVHYLRAGEAVRVPSEAGELE